MTVILDLAGLFCILCCMSFCFIVWLFMSYSNWSFTLWIHMLIDVQRLLTSKEFWSGPLDVLQMLQSTAMHLEHKQNIYSAMQQSWHTFETLHEIVPDSWLSTYLGCQLSTDTGMRNNTWTNSWLGQLICQFMAINSPTISWLSIHGCQFVNFVAIKGLSVPYAFIIFNL